MMKKKQLLAILSLSILLSVTGYILDYKERVDDVLLNVFEITMMSILIFAVMTALYFAIHYLRKGFRLLLK